MQKSQRLIQMIMRINAKPSFTVRELAEEFGLSTRTITRDLLELSELGVPVYSIQGRGGGYKLLREKLLPPISFTEGEAVAMFFACQAMEHYGSLPFGEGADSALGKFYHYLPGDTKERIDRLRDKVMFWSPHRPMSADILQVLLQAVMDRSVVAITYRSQSGLTQRNIQPAGLYASSGYWYCPAYCFQREDNRQFRADRILSADINPDIPYRDDVSMKSLRDKPAVPEEMLLHLEITVKGVWLLESNARAAPYMERKADGSGTVMIPIAAENLDFYVDFIWQMGAEVRLVGPEEGVAAMRRKIESMRSLYMPDNPE